MYLKYANVPPVYQIPVAYGARFSAVYGTTRVWSHEIDEMVPPWPIRVEESIFNQPKVDKFDYSDTKEMFGKREQFNVHEGEEENTQIAHSILSPREIICLYKLFYFKFKCERRKRGASFRSHYSS